MAGTPKVIESFMLDLKTDTHDAVNKAISDFRYEHSLEEREKLTAMQIFPLQGTRAPCPRWVRLRIA